jgi:hypothetical protein
VFVQGAAVHSDADEVYAARLTDTVGRARVVQALLIVVLVCSLAAWALRPRIRMLTGSPTSIAAVMALLVNGNLYDLLPPEEVGDEEREKTEKALRTLKFRMGWGSVVMPNYVVEKGPRFGIFGAS